MIGTKIQFGTLNCIFKIMEKYAYVVKNTSDNTFEVMSVTSKEEQQNVEEYVKSGEIELIKKCKSTSEADKYIDSKKLTRAYSSSIKRNVFSAIKSRCKTKRQMIAFNELISSFAKPATEVIDSKDLADLLTSTGLKYIKETFEGPIVGIPIKSIKVSKSEYPTLNEEQRSFQLALKLQMDGKGILFVRGVSFPILVMAKSDFPNYFTKDTPKATAKPKINVRSLLEKHGFLVESNFDAGADGTGYELSTEDFSKHSFEEFMLNDAPNGFTWSYGDHVVYYNPNRDEPAEIYY